MPEPLLEYLELFHRSNVVRLAVPFIIFTALLVMAKGPRGLRLSDETLRSVTVTLLLLIINGYLAAYLVITVDLSTGGYELLGLPSLSSGVWRSLPWPVTLVAVLLLFDVADYWTHRPMHNSLLWGVHAVHHSEQRMTWLSSSRVHVFETTIMKLGYVVLIGWTGMPLWALAAANALAYMHNRYVHCDLGWNHGRLAKIVASPNWHRWHHSVDRQAYNTNYANIFPFLDVLFGTYHNPGRCLTEVGLAELPKPGVVNQMLYPFSYLVQQARADLEKHSQRVSAPVELPRQ
ncbi:MAG: sterol desaturase family protein [Acidimicrobiales bacterium]